MATLILTDEEKASATYLDWSDESIGRAVKALAAKVGDEYGQESMYSQMCATMLAAQARRVNAQDLEIILRGVTDGDLELGDWRITVEKIGEENEAQS